MWLLGYECQVCLCLVANQMEFYLTPVNCSFIPLVYTLACQLCPASMCALLSSSSPSSSPLLPSRAVGLQKDVLHVLRNLQQPCHYFGKVKDLTLSNPPKPVNPVLTRTQTLAGVQ